MSEFLTRLKQHHLYGVVVAYAVVVGFLIQLVSRAFPYFGWAGAVPAVIIILLLGFPVVVVVLAWLLIKPKDPTKSDTWQRRHWKLSAAVTIVVIVLVVISGFYGLRFSESRAERLAATSVGTPAPAQSAPALTTAPMAATVIPAQSVAVLPFANLNGDTQEAYFSDGITVEILNALAQIPALKVAGRTSAFAFKGKDENPHTIGQILGVATLLEGSVQKAGDEVRITVQLVDTRSGYQLWSENYDRKLTNIFAIEDEISNEVADKLRVQWNSARPLVAQGTVDPRAHDFYLRGLALLAARGPGLRDAVTAFQNAVRIDPNYAQAWAGLSQVYELLPWYNLDGWQQSLGNAEDAARRALALTPRLGDAHAALANVLRDRLDFASAVSEYHEALALDPGSSEIHNQYAQLLGAVGQLDAAIKQEGIAVTLNPLAPDPRYVLGWALVCMHRNTEGTAELKRVTTQAPTFARARYLLMIAYLSVRNYAGAERTARTLPVDAGDNSAVLVTLIRSLTDTSLRSEALKLVGSNKGLIRFFPGPVEMQQAFWYSLLGAHDQAIETLQHWVVNPERGDVFFGMFSLWFPAFDPIRNDPRFKAVLKKMGLPYIPSKIILAQ